MIVGKSTGTLRRLSHALDLLRVWGVTVLFRLQVHS